jgi:hypothetical protein
VMAGPVSKKEMKREMKIALGCKAIGPNDLGYVQIDSSIFEFKSNDLNIFKLNLNQNQNRIKCK